MFERNTQFLRRNVNIKNKNKQFSRYILYQIVFGEVLVEFCQVSTKIQEL